MMPPHIEREYLKVRNEYIEELNKLKPEKGLKNIELFYRKGLWALDNVEPKFHCIFGNAKLPPTTCIVNLGTWFNCSGRKEGFCEICKQCYDKQIEVRFKERTKDRLEHEIYWRATSAREFAYDIIDNIIEYENQTGIKVNLIRWAEVGELRNREDLQKVISCSNIIFQFTGIKSYIYTHNKDLNFSIWPRPYLTINGSGFMIDNEYRVVKDKETEFNNLNDLSNNRECICDCTQCSYCSKKDGFVIIEELR